MLNSNKPAKKIRAVEKFEFFNLIATRMKTMEKRELDEKYLYCESYIYTQIFLLLNFPEL